MIKPFLKWAGGKSKSLDVILSTIGEIEGRLIEPFVGSGVVSLNIQNRCVIGDYSGDLINVYTQLKLREDFVAELSYYFSGEFNNKEKFYELRDLYNTLPYNLEKALLFIYLNRHCFNGLYRCNKSGKFNVPFGKYDKVHFPSKELLTFKEKLLNCEIHNKDFKETMLLAGKGDVIYSDPPYIPLSPTASFVDYNAGGFGFERQKELAMLSRNAVCDAFISNHDNEISRELYKDADLIVTMNVSRHISANSSGRGKVGELLAVFKNT